HHQPGRRRPRVAIHIVLQLAPIARTVRIERRRNRNKHPFKQHRASISLPARNAVASLCAPSRPLRQIFSPEPPRFATPSPLPSPHAAPATSSRDTHPSAAPRSHPPPPSPRPSS